MTMKSVSEVLSTRRLCSLNKFVIDASLSFSYILVNCRGYGQILIILLIDTFTDSAIST